MTRPFKRTVDYFPHFVNPGRTLLILQNEFGNDGYAFWFKLLSLLCKSDGQVYDYNNHASWRLLLAETSVSEDTTEKILQLLAGIGAIDPVLYQGKIIWVQQLVDNLSDVFLRRRNGSVPEKPVIANINPVPEPVIANNKPQTRPDHTKPDQTKNISIKKAYGEFNNVFLTDEEYQKLKDKLSGAADSFIERVSGYLESHKKKRYDSHYATILNWSRRDDGKNKNPRDLPREYTKSPDYPDLA